MKYKLISLPLATIIPLLFVSIVLADLGGITYVYLTEQFHFNEQIIVIGSPHYITILDDSFHWVESLLTNLLNGVITTITQYQTIFTTLNGIAPCSNCFTYTGDFISTVITVWVAPIVMILLIVLSASYAGIRTFLPVMIIGITVMGLMVWVGILAQWWILLIVVGLSFGVLQFMRKMLSGDSDI